MSLIVQKYGGTSVRDTDRIRNVARRVLETQQAGHQVVVTVSAMAGVTDQLIGMARQLCPTPPEREMDMLLSTGEQTSIALTAMALHGMGAKAISLTGAQAGIITDGVHTKARIQNISPESVKQLLSDGFIVIVAGFQGKTLEGQVTTLGRGGSDLTAIAIAGALKADLCQIFTDVDGVYTCDPRIVPEAKKLQEISYDEMLEMASSGSKVMQSRAVEFGKKFRVPFEVRSSLNDNPGTVVKEETMSMENVVIRGISVERAQAKVTVGPLSDEPGVAAKLFTTLSQQHIVVDMIVQNVSMKGHTDITFTVHRDDLDKTIAVLKERTEDMRGAEVRAEGGIAKLSVVGIGMRTHSGVAAELFECLADAGVNIQMISTSEIKIAVIIDEDEVEKAAHVTHKAFGLDQA
jgi:aspartate kinase